MRPDRIVMPPPLLNQHLRLAERREQATRQQLVSKLGIEALAVAVLPRIAWLDKARLHTDPAEPLPHVPGDELRPIVLPAMLRRAMRQEQIGKAVEHVVGPGPRRLAVTLGGLEPLAAFTALLDNAPVPEE